MIEVVYTRGGLDSKPRQRRRWRRLAAYPGRGQTVSKASDIGSKRLIGLAPDAWARWVTQQPDLVAEEIVAADFQWVSRESDVLLRVTSPTIGPFLVLNEIQLRYDPRMPRRMNAYAALAEERYDLPVYPVLVNILPPPAGAAAADHYETTVLGLHARRDYRVLNLWEVDAAEVVRQPLPPLLPFVPVLRGGNDEGTVRQALTALRADARLDDLEPLLAFFATFVLDSRLVQQIMRWDMIVLEQSPWYQEILARGEARMLQRILAARFGPLAPELLVKLDSLDQDQLDLLAEPAATAPTLADFEARLPN
jgi:predicted transposase YdaD